MYCQLPKAAEDEILTVTLNVFPTTTVLAELVTLIVPLEAFTCKIPPNVSTIPNINILIFFNIFSLLFYNLISFNKCFCILNKSNIVTELSALVSAACR